MTCEHCGNPMLWDGGTCTTLVGFANGDCGKPHDNNCKSRCYKCPDGHTKIVWKQPSCACGWRGNLTCFCHPGEKVSEWPI